jgi:hypothetical protein
MRRRLIILPLILALAILGTGQRCIYATTINDGIAWESLP